MPEDRDRRRRIRRFVRLLRLPKNSFEDISTSTVRLVYSRLVQ